MKRDIRQVATYAILKHVCKKQHKTFYIPISLNVSHAKNCATQRKFLQKFPVVSWKFYQQNISELFSYSGKPMQSIRRIIMKSLEDNVHLNQIFSKFFCRDGQPFLVSEIDLLWYNKTFTIFDLISFLGNIKKIFTYVLFSVAHFL